MTAGELAAAARGFMRGGVKPDAQVKIYARGIGPIWPRAVALLGRQALEQGLDDLWAAVAPRVRGASLKAQLLCLGEFVPDEDLVSRLRHAWHGLSHACHHQVYELSPTEAELSTWLDAVDRLVTHDPMRK